MFSLPRTTSRVEEHTADEVNEQIRRETDASIRHYRDATDLEIMARLRALDYEWDMERTLEANAAGISLVGLALGIGVDRKFLALPALVSGFLLQHAVQGWCPPVPAFRRMGVRTAREIDRERDELRKILNSRRATEMQAEESELEAPPLEHPPGTPV